MPTTNLFAPSGDVEGINSFSIAMRHQGEFYSMSLPPLKYASPEERYSAAKAIAEWTNGLSTLKYSSIKATVGMNSDRTVADDPGVEPKGKNFSFRVKDSDWSEGEPVHSTSLFLPSFTVDNGAESHAAAVALLGILNAHSAGYVFELVEN